MDKGVIYDAVSDFECKFSQEFRKYVRDENLICLVIQKYYYTDAFARKDAWLFKKEQQPNDVESADRDLTNMLLTMFETLGCVHWNCLFQFWSAEVTNVNDSGEKRCILTTRNQPFLLTGYKFDGFLQISDLICSYRRKMVGIVDNDGVIYRVFRTKRVEFTPNIRFYSYEEHPRRDLAISCGVKGSLAIPLADSSGCSVGVLEIVSACDIYPSELCFVLQASSSLRYFRPCKGLCGQFDEEDESLQVVVSEIRKVVTVVGESCDLLYAQTWMMCKHCDSLSVAGSLDYKLNASYYGTFVLWPPDYSCTLKKGEGVVGKATISSHSFVYCEDVSQFSIIQYSMAHFAHRYGHKSCFAIGLKSDLTGSQIYVLELFLDPCKLISATKTLLRTLEGMRRNFRTLKLASGEQIGDDLSVQVIDAKFPHISQTVKISELNSMEYPTLESDFIHNVEERGVGLAIDNGENMIKNIDEGNVAITPLEKQQQNNAQVCNDGRVDVVGTSQQPLVQVNVVHTEENIVGTSKECIVNSSKLPIRRGGIDISLEEPEAVSGIKCKDAAQKLNVCVSTHRDYNTSRWPPRKRKIGLRGFFFCVYFVASISKSRHVRIDYDHDYDYISTGPSRKRKIVHSPRNSVQMGSIKELRVSTPAVQNENLMTVEQKYGDNFSVPVIDRSSEFFFTDLSLGIGMNTTRRPYPLPHSIGETSTKEIDDPITAEETSFRDIRTLFSASTVQSELRVTVKAKFGGDFFIFQLFSSSGIHELSQQVSQRLNLEVGTYVVKYLDDDDDLILIVCDDDLQQYISSSISKGRFTLKIVIEPIKAL